MLYIVFFIIIKLGFYLFFFKFENVYQVNESNKND